MTMITSLSTAKAHLRIDGNDEDALLQLYIAAAEAYVNDYCDTKEAPFTSFTPTIQAAVLLVISDLYENRTAQVEKNLYKNNAVESLLNFNRNF